MSKKELKSNVYVLKEKLAAIQLVTKDKEVRHIKVIGGLRITFYQGATPNIVDSNLISRRGGRENTASMCEREAKDATSNITQGERGKHCMRSPVCGKGG